MNEKSGTQVVQLIEVDPNKLIEIGQRLKQTAMDTAYPGESVIIQFTTKITFVYHPEAEFLKPRHTIGMTLSLSAEGGASEV
jgi:hypothetical protein